MKSHKRQLHERKTRKGWAQATQARILKALNGKPSSPSAERVLWLLQALRTLETIRLQLSQSAEIDWPAIVEDLGQRVQEPQDIPPGYGIQHFSDPKSEQLNQEFLKLSKEINGHLKRYQWTPAINFPGFFVPPMRTNNWSAGSSEDNWENAAVDWLLGHATMGGTYHSPCFILRFRQCRRCRTWFYATTDTNVHCSAACRQKLYSESPEFRRTRAQYMKRWRKEDNEAQKRAAFRAHEMIKRKGR